MKKVLQGVNLSALSDGYAGRVIDEAFREVTKDLYERGNDGKPRVVTIKVKLTPEGNNITDIDIEADVKKPPMRPPSTKAKLDMAAGGLVFNPDCSDNPDQLVIPQTERDG